MFGVRPTAFNFSTFYFGWEYAETLNCLEQGTMSPFPKEKSRCRGNQLSTFNPKCLLFGATTSIPHLLQVQKARALLFYKFPDVGGLRLQKNFA